MTLRRYENFSSPTVKRIRQGQVGNGLKSNNAYQSHYDFADGKYVRTNSGWNEYQPPGVHAYNRLYDRVVEKVRGGPQSELLTAAAEWKSSLDMVNRRTLWIIESYKSFRRFDLPATIRKLVKPVVGSAYRYGYKANERGFMTYGRASKYRKRRLPSVTEHWLEYWLGWAPAMGDIYNALDVLQREFPSDHIRVGTRYEDRYETLSKASNYFESKQTIRQGKLAFYADAKVTNYNLHLLDQLGLVNPVTTAFDVIPFSFVLGWFINVKQVLSSLTDCAGVSLTNQGIGIFQTRESQLVNRVYSVNEAGTGYNWKILDGSASGVSRIRSPQLLPRPQLALQFDRLSLTRAATSVSLLVELFLRKKD